MAELGGGDFVREEDLIRNRIGNPPQINLDGMNKFIERSNMELESLIREVDDIVKLDEHIQKWAKKMKDAIIDDGSKEKYGMAEEKFDSKMHVVNDKLWKASNDLLDRLQDVRKQGQTLAKSKDNDILALPVLPPPPRSAKLDLGTISDDSDVEEYERALEKVQVCLGDDDKHSEEQRNKCTGEKSESEKEKGKSDEATRKKSLLDCAEESGQEYVKENIEFITQMRKYKEALMKIHNREVDTAQEIKELLPKGSVKNPNPGESDTWSSKGNLTPRLIQSNHMAPLRPITRSGGASRHQPFSVSTRLPPLQTPTPLSHPMTARTFDAHSQAQQNRQRLLGSKLIVPSQLKQNQRPTKRNPLYTVR